MVICLQQGADLHVAQLMSLPLTVSCFSKIQIGFIFLVPAHPGSPRKKAGKWVYYEPFCTSSKICAQRVIINHNKCVVQTGTSGLYF